MKVQVGEYMDKPSVTVRLSERNLTVLNELWEDAKAGLGLPTLYRFDASEDTMIAVVIEADEYHYKNRDAARGGNP